MRASVRIHAAAALVDTGEPRRLHTAAYIQESVRDVGTVASDNQDINKVRGRSVLRSDGLTSALFLCSLLASCRAIEGAKAIRRPGPGCCSRPGPGAPSSRSRDGECSPHTHTHLHAVSRRNRAAPLFTFLRWDFQLFYAERNVEFNPATKCFSLIP